MNLFMQDYYIELTKGQKTLVDRKTFPLLTSIKWYAGITKNKKDFYARHQNLTLMHRFIWENFKGPIPENYVIDHINGNTLDNRLENLQCITQKENTRKQRKKKNNTSGYRGVSFSQRTNKWLARIQVDYKFIHLGLFSNKEQAAIAYNNAAKKYFGDFAVLNEI